jgi:hypothetical protein
MEVMANNFYQGLFAVQENLQSDLVCPACSSKGYRINERGT